VHLDVACVEKMNRAAKAFVGKQDFASYMAQGSSVATTVRTVYDASVVREGDLVVFRVSADGFLYNMVRIFTGTLLEVAEGKILPEDIPKITAARDRKMAGMTVLPHGLYLNKVVY
jgi:tRNA pseudouridine38-40 synthase